MIVKTPFYGKLCLSLYEIALSMLEIEAIFFKKKKKNFNHNVRVSWDWIHYRIIELLWDTRKILIYILSKELLYIEYFLEWKIWSINRFKKKINEIKFHNFINLWNYITFSKSSKFIFYNNFYLLKSSFFLNFFLIFLLNYFPK